MHSSISEMALEIAVIIVTERSGGNMVGVYVVTGIINICVLIIVGIFWKEYLDEHQIFGKIDTFFGVDD